MTPLYLRLSVTARCNLRCLYCRSGADVGGETAGEFSADELGMLVRCGASEGVLKVRITGGEPLVRADLEEIFARIAAVDTVQIIALTTNGIGLNVRAAALSEAGLARVNVSLDTLRPERFVEMAGFDLHGEVLKGIDAAVTQFEEVKINTVVVPGFNEDETDALLRFAADRGIHIRFIELYHSPGAREVTGCVSAAELQRRLERSFGALEPVETPPLSIEKTFRIPALGGATVGLIASRSHPPCAACAKLRFTSEGLLIGCLYDRQGVDVSDPLRRGDSAALRAAFREAFGSKTRTGPESGALARPVTSMGG